MTMRSRGGKRFIHAFQRKQDEHNDQLRAEHVAEVLRQEEDQIRSLETPHRDPPLRFNTLVPLVRASIT